MILAAQGGAAGGSGKPGGYDFILMMVVVAVAFYFIILRPQRKEQAKREDLIKQLKKGDAVVSAGGIHGTVVDVARPETVVVEVDSKKGVRLTFNRSSISVINPDKSGKSAEAAGDEKKEADKQSK